MSESSSGNFNAYKSTVGWAAAAHIETIARDVSPSTNSEAKELGAQLGTRALVIAGHQTAGRGRGDHTWTDSSGQALLSSWIFHVAKSPQPVMSALIGLALFEAAKLTWPSIGWALKAPNDLHVVDASGAVKKIAGILIELTNFAIAQVSVTVGVGMNVSGAPSDTKPYAATSLATELAARGSRLTETDWSKFLSAWINGCEARVTEGLESSIRSQSRTALAAALRAHPEYRSLRDVEPDGSLVFDDGRRVAWTSL